MKKLNNEGWGLGVFLAFIAVFFVALITITYIATKNGFQENKEPIQPENEQLEKYKNYESIIKEQAIIYQENNYKDLVDGDSFYVSINKLDIDSHIKSECTGYVKFAYENNIYTYSPYLKCDNYRTNGYIESLDY